MRKLSRLKSYVFEKLDELSQTFYYIRFDVDRFGGIFKKLIATFCLDNVLTSIFRDNRRLERCCGGDFEYENNCSVRKVWLKGIGNFFVHLTALFSTLSQRSRPLPIEYLAIPLLLFRAGGSRASDGEEVDAPSGWPDDDWAIPVCAPTFSR